MAPSDQTPQEQNQTDKKPGPSSTSSGGYAAYYAAHPEIPRTKGRPVGWRKADMKSTKQDGITVAEPTTKHTLIGDLEPAPEVPPGRVLRSKRKAMEEPEEEPPADQQPVPGLVGVPKGKPRAKRVRFATEEVVVGLDSPQKRRRESEPEQEQDPEADSRPRKRRGAIPRGGGPAKRGRKASRKSRSKRQNKPKQQTEAGLQDGVQREPKPAHKFPVFTCLWDRCQTNLHNLATLKKHALKAHGRKPGSDGQYRCNWQDCKLRKDADDQDHHFIEKEDLQKHLEEHITEVAWKLGDGPSMGLQGEPIIERAL